jgi:hypothetical protein
MKTLRKLPAVVVLACVAACSSSKSDPAAVVDSAVLPDGGGIDAAKSDAILGETTDVGGDGGLPGLHDNCTTDCAVGVCTFLIDCADPALCKFCLAKVPTCAGSPCPADFLCVHPTVDSAEGICHPRRGVDLRCKTTADNEGNLCKDGLFCDDSKSLPVCTARSPTTGTCTGNTRWGCPDGTSCFESVCTENAKEGASCNAAQCEPGFYCEGFVCVARKPLGSSCTLGPEPNPSASCVFGALCIGGKCS